MLVPILNRRRVYKRNPGPGRASREMYEQRAKALKCGHWSIAAATHWSARNARFGRIECHESITAFGRDILVGLQTSRRGAASGAARYRVELAVAAGDGDVASYCEEITREIGIPLNLEGRYAWIVFLPNISTGVGALNRYYGKFEDGELKLRGIAVRREDTPLLVEDLQQDMLRHLSAAPDRSAFLGWYLPPWGGAGLLHRGGAHGDGGEGALIMRKSISRRLEEYVQLQRLGGRAAAAARPGLRATARAGGGVPHHGLRQQEFVAEGQGRPFLDGDREV